jgi:two-component system, OmpR family, sensor kinase
MRLSARLRSLRARLVAGVIALAAVCLIALGAIVYAQQRDFLLGQVDEQAAAAAPLVGRALDEQGVPRPQGDRDGDERGDGGPGRGEGGPRAGQSLPPGVYAERRDAAGTKLGSVVLTYGQDAPSPPTLPADVPEDETITVDARDGSLEYRVDSSPSPFGGSTIVAIPLSGVDDQLDHLLLVEALVIAGALLLMAALGWWVVRLGLRPLERIGDTAGKIAAGDLSQRVEPAEPATEVGRLGMSLNAMLHQIEEAFDERAASEERLRVFLADASHELRTPLASIRGYAELYRMGAARDGMEAETAMARIEQEAARMGLLVEDLLLLARLDEVRETAREPVDLAQIARDAAADARAMAPDRRVDLRLDGGDTLVLGEEDRLRQVVGNLTRNALVHTPDGTDIELVVTQGGERVRLEVNDRGPGLPVPDGAVMFERFWRAEPARARGAAGAGLGLAIVDGIVRAHGGQVSAKSRPEGGASFTIALPALEQGGQPAAARAR